MVREVGSGCRSPWATMPRRRGRAVSLLVSLVLGGIPAGTVVGAERAGAEAVFRVHTWNAARGNRDFKGDPGHYEAVILYTVDFVNTFPAWQVTLNEVCHHVTTRVPRSRTCWPRVGTG